MIGPDSDPIHPIHVLFMTQDEAGQGKRLALFLDCNCVVIYVLCEALHCHAGKCQVRYFARSN